MRTVLIAALVWTTSLAAMAAPDQSGIPERFTNLQVFPASVTRSDLMAVMRQYAFHLDVRCEHCHVGEGNDLSQFDFASDARPAKTVARRMQRMVDAINSTWLEGIGTPSDTPRVTCFTCHRGQLRPATDGGGAATW